jgi:cytoskeletal protein CcmA (bactofilin family)
MRTTYLAGFSMFLVIFGAPAVAQRVGGTVTIEQRLLTDQYVAGRIVRVNAPIDGDLVVAGQRLIVDGNIGGDLIAAGESLEVRRAVADDIRAAGRTIIISGPVSGHIVAGGEEVNLSPGSSIADWAWLAGRTVTIEGRIGQELRAAGENVTLTGRVDGDANLMGQRIRVGPGAMIGGDLIVQSRTEPDIANEATIDGEVIREDLPGDGDGIGPFRWIRGTAGFVYFAATLITAVLAFALLFPGFSRATSDRLAAMPLRAVGTGLLAAIGTPVLIALVFMTGIGLIVGFGLLGTYILMLLLATLLGIIAVGHLGLKLASKARAPQLPKTILALVIATVAVLLILQIPVLGGLILLLLMLSGLGAVAGELWGRYRQAA